MIAVEELRTGYGRIGVLDSVSLAVAPGECVGILGHNGMGKSTLMRAIMGLLPAWSGRIVLDGAPVERWPAHRRARAGIALVPQGRMIFPGLSVRDNLRFGAAAKGHDDIDAAVADFPELARLLDRPGGALSGGEQQLLALARALCGQPRLLLLDEPTEGIQPSIVEALVERIGHLRAARGLSVLLVEQNLDFIRALAERVLVIQRGRIVHELPREAVLDPALEHEFIGI